MTKRIEVQVAENTAAIQALIDEAKKIGQVPKIIGDPNDADMFIMEIEATGETVSITKAELITIIETGVGEKVAYVSLTNIFTKPQRINSNDEFILYATDPSTGNELALMFDDKGFTVQIDGENITFMLSDVDGSVTSSLDLDLGATNNPFKKLFLSDKAVLHRNTDVDVYDFFQFKAGNTQTMRRYMEWLRFDDTRDALFGVNAQGLFIMYDAINSYHVLTGGNNGDTQLNAGGTGKVYINHEASNANVGTGGLEIRNGDGTGATSNRCAAFSNNGNFLWNGKGLKAYHSNNSDYLEMFVASNGQSYLVSTMPLKFKSNDDEFAFVDGSYVTKFDIDAGVAKLIETSSWGPIEAGYLQFRVKDGTPNTLWIRDDAGNEFQLGKGDLKSYTVAALPAGSLGDRAIVTDATSPTYLGTLTGGGSVTCPVFFDDTNWVSN